MGSLGEFVTNVHSLHTIACFAMTLSHMYITYFTHVYSPGLSPAGILSIPRATILHSYYIYIYSLSLDFIHKEDMENLSECGLFHSSQ